jgi:DNA-binding transcriptional LysR family regulator
MKLNTDFSRSLQDHLEKVQAFSVVARIGSFRKAAVQLRRTQPSISRAVKILEDIIGQPLFLRTQKGVHLTPAGTALLEFNSRIGVELGRVEHRLRTGAHEGKKGLSGSIFVGSYGSHAIRMWPHFIRELTRKHPNISISLKTDCGGEKMLEMLRSSELDLTITISPRAHPALVHQPIYSDQFAIYGSVKHLKEKIRNLEELRKVPFIMVGTATYGEGQTLEQLVWKLGLLSRQMVHELDSFEAAKEFIAEGVGVGILPRWVANPAMESKKIREIKIPDLGSPDLASKAPLGLHTFHASYRKTDLENPALLAVISEATAFLKARGQK